MLDIVGVGYRAQIQGKKIMLTLGYSHPVEFPLPDGITAAVDQKQTQITLAGIDKQKIGQVAADLRSLRSPDAYKGKGVRFSGFHTLGLKSDGTVVAVGFNDYKQCNVTNWNLKQGPNPPPCKPTLPGLPWITLLLDDEIPSSKPIPNGDFEHGQSAWTEYSQQPGYAVTTTTFPTGVAPHSGSYAVWQGGVSNNTKYIRQSVTVLAAFPYLTFYHWISSGDTCGFDYGYVSKWG